MNKFCAYVTVIALISSTNMSYAQETSKDANRKDSVQIPRKESDDDILKSLDYPELQVVPRATDRLAMETQNEREYGWLAFWPYQVSSLATLAAGNRLRGNYTSWNDTEQEQKDSDNVANATMALGIGGLGLSIFLIKLDLYGDAYRRVKTVKGNDRRSELMRERLAEEALEKPSQLINMLTTVSVVSNLLANTAVLTQANGDVRAYAAVGILASFLPWMFKNRYVDNWDKQQEYKRKIYTPLIGWNYEYRPETKQLQPQLTMNWLF
jgi:hypothetical protein